MSLIFLLSRSFSFSLSLLLPFLSHSLLFLVRSSSLSSARALSERPTRALLSRTDTHGTHTLLHAHTHALSRSRPAPSPRLDRKVPVSRRPSSGAQRSFALRPGLLSRRLASRLVSIPVVDFSRGKSTCDVESARVCVCVRATRKDNRVASRETVHRLRYSILSSIFTVSPLASSLIHISIYLDEC